MLDSLVLSASPLYYSTCNYTAGRTRDLPSPSSPHHARGHTGHDEEQVWVSGWFICSIWCPMCGDLLNLHISQHSFEKCFSQYQISSQIHAGCNKMQKYSVWTPNTAVQFNTSVARFKRKRKNKLVPFLGYEWLSYVTRALINSLTAPVLFTVCETLCNCCRYASRWWQVTVLMIESLNHS